MSILELHSNFKSVCYLDHISAWRTLAEQLLVHLFKTHFGSVLFLLSILIVLVDTFRWSFLVLCLFSIYFYHIFLENACHYLCFGIAGRTKTWLELQDMLVWTPTLVLVCVAFVMLSTDYFTLFSWWLLPFHKYNLFFIFVMYRTEQEGWPGISWICPYVLSQREVMFPLMIFFEFFLLSFEYVLNLSIVCLVFLGRDSKQEIRNRSMRKLVKGKCPHLSR